ncbi:MAG: hypothetical protein ACOYLG_05750 [Chitinophagaceae bacterium]
MIVILDDTFNARHKYSDVGFLEDVKYKNACIIIHRPTKKDFRSIVVEFKNIHLLCNHRSLKLFNDSQDVIDGKEAIQNLFIQAQSENLLRLEFGRDMHSNFKAKTLDKDSFYSNLKPFLDNYIDTKQIELKILFYGENYAELEYLSAIDRMMDEINFSNSIDFKNNELILSGIKLVFSDREPLDLVEEWMNKGLSKKEIITIINNQI